MSGRKPTLVLPLFAAAIAAIGLTALLLVDHGPWSKPKVLPAQLVRHDNTASAARSAGATVAPTPPRDPVEPAVPGPKPAAPAIPDQGAR